MSWAHLLGPCHKFLDELEAMPGEVVGRAVRALLQTSLGVESLDHRLGVTR